MSTENKDLPLACTLDEDDLMARKQGDIAVLRGGVQSIAELPDGYELTFPGSNQWARNITEFILAERECCRFFTFETIYQHDGGQITLRIRGLEGVKAFLSELTADPVPRSSGSL
jgi:hypothetical protein